MFLSKAEVLNSSAQMISVYSDGSRTNSALGFVVVSVVGCVGSGANVDLFAQDRSTAATITVEENVKNLFCIVVRVLGLFKNKIVDKEDTCVVMAFPTDLNHDTIQIFPVNDLITTKVKG